MNIKIEVTTTMREAVRRFRRVSGPKEFQYLKEL